MTGPDGGDLGPWLVVAGALLILVGVGLWTGALGWFGRLPGDIRFEGERSRVYVPLASMVVISVLFTLLVNVFRRFF